MSKWIWYVVAVGAGLAIGWFICNNKANNIISAATTAAAASGATAASVLAAVKAA